MVRYLRLLLFLLILLTVPAILAQEGGEDSTDEVTEVELPITENVTYLVQTGDTLDTIAALFDVDLDCLRETNELSRVAILQPGDPLLIDVACPLYDGAMIVEVPREVVVIQTSGADEIYVVQRGDTLDTIGQALDVSVEAIALANDLDNPGRIQIGQQLIIPADAPPYGQVPALDGGLGQGGGLDVDGEIYVVQRGDTLDTIGQELNVSVVSLQVVNGIENGRSLRIGQTIVIPADAPAYGEYPALDGGPGQGGGLSVEGEIYVVQPRDTLDTIGQEFNISVVYLAQINEIDNPGRITPGQSLIIPDEGPAYGEYPALDGGVGQGGGAEGEVVVVQPRETIDGISARYNKLTSCVLEANDILNPRRVTPGTTVVIPDSCPAYAGADVVGGGS